MNQVTVRLTGANGNVYNLIGLVRRALDRAGERAAATAFTNAARKCGSYDEVLQLIMRTVEVE